MALLTLLPGLAFLAGRVTEQTIADADLLLLHELIPDLLNGGSIDHWNIPYATYMLPDWPLYWLSLALTSAPAAAIALFAILQVALLAVVLYLVAREIDQEGAPALALISLSVLVVGILWNAYPVAQLAASFVHGGTAIMAVAALALLMRWCRTPTRAWVLASALLTGLAVASDRLFVVWSLAPAVAVVAVYVLTRRATARGGAVWLAAHALAVAVAWPIAGLLFPNRTPYELQLGFRPRFGLRRFAGSFEQVHDSAPLLLPAVFIAALVGAAILLRGRSLLGQSVPAHARVAIAVYSSIVAIGTVAAQVVMIGGVAPSARYSTPMFVLPLALCPMLAFGGFLGLRRSITSHLTRVVATVPVLIALMCAATFAGEVTLEREIRPAECVLDALSASGSRRGISSYWDARPFQVYSEGKLEMTEFDPELAPMRANMNLREVGPSYDFAIVSPLFGAFNLSSAAIDSVAGAPKATASCGPWTILDYGPGGLTFDLYDQAGTGK